MGSFAKNSFGFETLGNVGIIIGGSNKKDFIKHILNQFDDILYFKEEGHSKRYTVKKDGKKIALAFDVYGSPCAIDIVCDMYDGGTSQIIFIGYAYGGFKKENDVGDIIIPNKSYHFDGMYHHIDEKRVFAENDYKLNEIIKEILNNNSINFKEGANISVQSVKHQLLHNNEKYAKIKPVTCEMETSSVLSKAKDIGVRATSILVISDNKTSSYEDKLKRDPSKRKVTETIINNLDKFTLNNLSNKYNIKKHLANIIHHPDEEFNIYKN